MPEHAQHGICVNGKPAKLKIRISLWSHHVIVYKFNACSVWYLEATYSASPNLERGRLWNAGKKKKNQVACENTAARQRRSLSSRHRYRLIRKQFIRYGTGLRSVGHASTGSCRDDYVTSFALPQGLFKDSWYGTGTHRTWHSCDP